MWSDMDGATLKSGFLGEHETRHGFGRHFTRQVVSYIEKCHMENGGYFFARIPPSSRLNTYFAVKSPSLLGVKRNYPEAIASSFLDNVGESTLGGITGIFAAVELLNELGRMTDEIRNYVQPRIMSRQNKAGGFGALENIDIEVPSELENTYRAVRVVKTIGAEFDERRIAGLVLGELNIDGGYGREGRSTLASTLYATEIHKLLGNDTEKPAATRDYLRKRKYKNFVFSCGSWVRITIAVFPSNHRREI